ncbi:MAG: GNAT family N-acetyltransferase [Candidatus Omnitrophota bacterium]
MSLAIKEFESCYGLAVRKLILKILLSEFPETMVAYPSTDLEDITGNYGGKRERFFIALDEEKVVGTIAVKEDDKKNALLRRIYVHPNYRNKGYGKMLLKTAIDFAKSQGYRRIVFRSTDKMSLANLLCKKNGFNEVSQVGFGGIKIVEFAHIFKNK